MQRAAGVGNNEQQNVVHRKVIEARGKLFFRNKWNTLCGWIVIRINKKTRFELKRLSTLVSFVALLIQHC